MLCSDVRKVKNKMLHFKALLLIRKEALFVSLDFGRYIDVQHLLVYVTFLPHNP